MRVRLAFLFRCLAPLIGHTGVSIDPASGEAQDFRRLVVYTVRAADGTSQAYVAYVSNGATVTTACPAPRTTCRPTPPTPRAPPTAA